MVDESGPDSREEPTYSLILEGNGVTIKRSVPESIARAITSLVMGGAESTQRPLRGAGGQAAGSAAGKVSIREYLNGVAAKRNADTITAIVAYLKDQGYETVTRDQVKDYFRKAGEPIPGNYTRDFTDALSTGWIAEDHANSGNYYITSSGEAALSNGFTGKIRRPAKRRNRKPSENEGA